MPFKRGHKLARGGKRTNAGRKPKTDVEIHKEAGVIAQEYIEAHIDPLLETYIGLAAGVVVERTTPEGVKEFVLHVDPATTRHAVDKILPEIDASKNQRPIAIQIIHEGSTQDIGVESKGNGIAIHIGGE